ncbi:MAG: discoidin domain-containing protein, partial [Planctomycetota bacterium]
MNIDIRNIFQRKTHSILLSALALALLAGSNVIAKTRIVKIKTSADSEKAGYESFRAMDGDPSTMWHTFFGAGDPRPPHVIILDLGDFYEISGFTYLPRIDSDNGTIKDYEFYVSNDKKKFGTPIIKGAFAKRNGENVIKFQKPAKGRYIKLRALSEVNNNPWTSIAELTILTEGIRFVSTDSAGLMIESPETETELQFEILRRDIQRRGHISRHAGQTFHRQSLILESDHDPLDVVLRRTKALVEDLKHMPDVPDLSKYENQLKNLQAKSSTVGLEEIEARYELFEKAYQLRRKISFSNPLLNFDKILFIKRHRPTFNHMCDQYYGINALPGGGLYILSDPFGENPQVKDILEDSVVEKGRLKGQKLTDGSFVSPGLSYDGKTIMFAYVECKGD